MNKAGFHNLSSIDTNVNFEHLQKMCSILEKILPEEMRFEDKSDFQAWIQESLPLFKWNETSSFSNCLTVYLLCLKSPQLQVETFFPEILRRWLIGGKEAQIISINQMFFSLKDFPDFSFFVGEVQIIIGSSQEWHDAINNLSFLAKEMTLALSSPSHAAHILMKRTSSTSSKVTLVHQILNRLMMRFPNRIDGSILDEVGRLLVLSSKEFLAPRKAEHISRLITSIYLLRKSLSRLSATFPHIHHLQARLIPTYLKFPFCSKPVLGCLVGIYFMEEYEFLEEKHILFAIQKMSPDAILIKGSTYSYEKKDEKIKLIYLEIGKKDGTTFSLDEKRNLYQHLNEHLKDRIEKLMPPIFMIRNEEEILRNILMLRREIRSIKDLPQVVISLDRQTKTQITFTIICVAVRQKEVSVLKRVLQRDPMRSLVIEKSQIVGYLRKKHPIEALIFHLSVPRDYSLLRADLSLNFYLARERAVFILQDILGEFRDYNGGMILKQTEILDRLKHEFSAISQTYPDLMENFFYSITPLEKQATIPFTELKTFFQLTLDTIFSELNHSKFCLKIQKTSTMVYVAVRFLEAALKEQLVQALESLSFARNILVFTHLRFKGSEVLSCALDSLDPAHQKTFTQAIYHVLESWQEKLAQEKVLNLTIPYAPTSLDPRLAGDEFTGSVLRLLFEGLMRINREGQIEKGLAESFHISSDRKTYTFRLRQAVWNNQMPVLAADFEYAWKKILSADFKTPYAYLFYPIKNAKEAKQGLRTLDQVGIKALDERTLQVELAFPAPYFLELTAHTIYFPVNQRVDTLYPHWPLQAEGYISNGAFLLRRLRTNESYELIKNPSYWDHAHIEMDKILISRENYHSANQMFRKGDVSWIGQPFGLWDLRFNPGKEDKVIISPDKGVYWYGFNTQTFPFQHLKLRRAFSLAINRHAITNILSTPTQPAYSPLLPKQSQMNGRILLERNLPLARQLFHEALKELELKYFPIVTLLYARGNVRDVAASLMKQQWEDAFGIRIRIEPLDWGTAFSKMKQGDFHICGILWRSLINDPIYILNSFRNSNEHINLSKWENPIYKKLLQLADYELDPEQRLKYLAQAEEILLQEVPILPVFYTDFRAIVKKHIQPPAISPFGTLDLKWTRFKNSSQ